MARVSIFLKSGCVNHPVTPTPFYTLTYETSTPPEIPCVCYYIWILFIYLDLRDSWRSLLSPLRLPVPPSRRFVEVFDSTAYCMRYSFVIQNAKCETVQESVKVFEDLHRFVVICPLSALPPFSG